MSSSSGPNAAAKVEESPKDGVAVAAANGVPADTTLVLVNGHSFSGDRGASFALAFFLARGMRIVSQSSLTNEHIGGGIAPGRSPTTCWTLVGRLTPPTLTEKDVWRAIQPQILQASRTAKERVVTAADGAGWPVNNDECRVREHLSLAITPIA